MRSVCIVGYAKDTRALANAEPPSVELWGMNVNHEFLKRWDRWFQIHPFVWKGRPFYGRDERHWNFLRTCGVPVYMTEPNAAIPTAVTYPINEVIASIGRDYLTSTAAYALALAITEGVDELKLYGFNGATEMEYIQQRPCIEWLLGIAQGRGVKIVMPETCPILHGARYPHTRAGEAGRAQERVDFNRNAYMDAWAKASEYLGAYRALETAGAKEQARDMKRQYLEAVMRFQRDFGKFNESVLALNRLGLPDVNSTKLPELEIPADSLQAEEVVEIVR